MIFEPKKRIVAHDDHKRLCSLVWQGKIKYYRNCNDIYTVKNLGKEPFINEYGKWAVSDEPWKKVMTFNDEYKNFNINQINFLDFKLTTNCFENYVYEDFLWKYLNFGEEKKLLHVVADMHKSSIDLFHEPEWKYFCELLREFDVNKCVHLEIHNVTQNLDFNIKEDLNFDYNKFEIIDLHIIHSNTKAFYMNIKCHDEVFIENHNFIEYNPNADRKG